MTDQDNTAEAATLNLPGCLGFDLGVAAQLGTKANGAEITILKKPDGMLGVPNEVPVGLLRGESPEFESVAGHFENYRTHPARKSGTAQVQTFESLVSLTQRHKTANSAVFANMEWRNPSITTVVDYHEDLSGGLADNGKHRIHYPFPLSDEWKAWVEKDGQMMKQADFAWFLEDRIPDLASPTEEEKIRYERDFNLTFATPSQVVELSRGLQVFVDTKVKNTVTLQSGEGQISFEETHNDASGKPLKVPGLFMLSVAPFFMGDKVRMPVRLRYRPVGGQLNWFFNIYRPDLFITEHVRHALFDVRERTGLPVFEGRPEMPA